MYIFSLFSIKKLVSTNQKTNYSFHNLFDFYLSTKTYLNLYGLIIMIFFCSENQHSLIKSPTHMHSPKAVLNQRRVSFYFLVHNSG